MGGRRAKAARTKPLGGRCQLRKLALELLARGEERAVVMEAVQPNLEATRGQFGQDALVDRIVAGDDVERGAKAAFLFEIGDLECAPQPVAALNVVGQDQRRAVALRPEPGERRLLEAGRAQQAVSVETDKSVDRQVADGTRHRLNSGPVGSSTAACASKKKSTSTSPCVHCRVKVTVMT